jgi:hypothetical protein
MGKTPRLRTQVVCGHHNAVLVFDCEDAGSRNNGLSARIGSAKRWVRDGLDRLGVLDPVSKGVFGNIGPLVDRICSVGIKAIVPLRMVQSAPGSQNEREQTDWATPVCWEVIHGGV